MKVVYMATEEEEEGGGGAIKVGSLVFCPICGTQNEVTMSYTQYDPQNNGLSTGSHRFHCSSCGSNLEFRLIWDWDIDKLYR